MTSWYSITGLAVVLLLWLLYKEWTREKKSSLYGRLLASLLAVIGLAGMAYPGRPDSNENDSNRAVVLTDGFSTDSLTDFLKRQHAAVPVFSVIPVRQYTKTAVQLTGDWQVFAAKHAADTLHVFGNGLDEASLALLQNHPLVFHANPLVPAITHIYWKQQLETGEPLVVQGGFENSSKQKIKILLQAFGAGRDSAFVAAGESSFFSLHTVPLHTGRAVYKLIIVAGKDTLQQEPLPVAVQSSAALQLLIIAASPDFDNTYLKNQLAQQGYQVTVTTTTSTHATDRQFLNTPAQAAAARLNSEYLGKFDAVMADQEALQKLSAAEQAALRSVIADRGTGLVLKMDAEDKPAAFYDRFFSVKKLQQDKEGIYMLQGAADSNRYALKMIGPAVIKYLPGQQILLQDAGANIFAAAVVYGSGKIVATTLQNTFSIALAGNKNAYQQLWWLLLHKAARKIYTREAWRTDPFIGFANDPVRLRVESQDTILQQAVAGRSTIYPAKNALFPFIGKAVYWPDKPGWQALPQMNTAAGSWYVYQKEDWQQLINHQHTTATQQYAAMHPLAVKAVMPAAGNHITGNVQLWLLLVFLAACIFLWVEQKAG